MRQLALVLAALLAMLCSAYWASSPLAADMTPEQQARQTVTTILTSMQRPPDMGMIPIKGVVICASFEISPRVYKAMGWYQRKPVWKNGHWLKDKRGRKILRPQMSPEKCMYVMNAVMIGPARIVRVARHGKRVAVRVAVKVPKVTFDFLLEPVCSYTAQNCYRAVAMRVTTPAKSKTAA